jgi:putative NADH-flavin reductase
MNIIVFGATGQVGKRIITEALAKGHNVKAFGRNTHNLIDEESVNDNLEAIIGYVFDADAVADALEGCDVVLSALGGSFDGEDKTRSLGIKIIITQMEKLGIQRIVAVGNQGILEAEDGSLIMEHKDFPPEYLPVAHEHLKAYEYLKNASLQWTMVCPPDIQDADATYQYVTSPNTPPAQSKGHVTAGDIADCMLQEATANQYINTRVGISN